MNELKRKIFLTAGWENLILATYEVDPGMLKFHLPEGLEPDTINGSAFVSLVAFDFVDTKVKGIKIPYNVNFPEINLRFYVKNKERRGVVFVKEFVPNYLTVIGANIFFNENYEHIGMTREMSSDNGIRLQHTIEVNSKIYFVRVHAANSSFMPHESSAEHFFKEHEWGFGTTRSGHPLAYSVEHPRWEIYPVTGFETNFDFGEIYGPHWESIEASKPYNVTLAKGSAVKVFDSEPLEFQKK